MRQRSLLLVLGVSGALSVTGCGDHNEPAMEDEGMRRAEYTPTTGDEQGVDVHAQTETQHAEPFEDPSMDPGRNPAPGGATPDPWAMEGVGEAPTVPGTTPISPEDPFASADVDDTPTPDESTANLEAEYRDAEGTLFRVGPVSARDQAGNVPSDPNAMTATSNQLPEGTVVRVERVDVPGSAVIVRIERGETTGDAILQLSQAAADRLGVSAPDTADARIVILESEDASRTASAEPMPNERGDRTASASPTPEDDRTASANVPRRSPANR